jgi:hypothetical protein
MAQGFGRYRPHLPRQGASEQETVVFLLGGTNDGAIQWATQSPNVLNVAVTSAQRRLYVVSDRARWTRWELAVVLANSIETVTAAVSTRSSVFASRYSMVAAGFRGQRGNEAQLKERPEKAGSRKPTIASETNIRVLEGVHADPELAQAIADWHCWQRNQKKA